MAKLPHTEEVPDELFEAARVRRVMTEDQMGRWRLIYFTVSEESYGAKILSLRFSSDSEKVDMEVARAVPPGDWIVLQRKMTPQERVVTFEDALGRTTEMIASAMNESVENVLDRFLPDDRSWIPVMSDTPAEILEHHHALNHARGKVVITGLGLGCLPHALLTLPDVTRIDIIDIDPDVIALTGPYLLNDERVHIHQGSAADEELVKRVAAEAGGWDYAWHDIWTHIAPRNLKDETAEHGISYRRLFRLYEQFASVQSAWAYDQAKWMRDVQKRQHEKELKLRQKLKSLPLDERVEMMYDQILRDRIKVGSLAPRPFEGEPIPRNVIDMLDPDGGLKEHIRTKLSEPDLWEQFPTHGAPEVEESIGSPNAHLEAH